MLVLGIVFWVDSIGDLVFAGSRGIWQGLGSWIGWGTEKVGGGLGGLAYVG